MYGEVNIWWLWCSGSTEACGAFSSGSTPDSHPNMKKPLDAVFSYLGD